MVNRTVGITKNKVLPQNNRTSFSFSGGNPICSFILAPQTQALLQPSSLRLNGVLRITDGTNRPSNQNTLAAGAVPVLTDSRVGAPASAIQSIRIRSLETSEILEENRDYARMLCSMNPCLTSFDGYKNHAQLDSGAFGREDAMGLRNNGDMLFSTKLKSGWLSGGGLIDLASQGGIVIELSIQSNSSSLYGASASTFDLELQDVNLTYNMVQMEKPFQAGADTRQFSGYQSYMNIVASSDDSQSLILAQQSVRAVFSNSVKSANINNFATNSLTCGELENVAGDEKLVQEYTHLRNNTRFPLHFSVNERTAVSDTPSAADGGGGYEAHKNAQFLSCFRPFKRYTHSLQSPVTQATKSAVEGDYDVPDEAKITGIGVNFDQTYTGQGADFRNASYALRVQSQLDSTPNALFTFTLSNQAVKANRGQIQQVM